MDEVREYPAVDRVAAYLAGTILDGEKTVDVTMGRRRALMEGELVMVMDAHLESTRRSPGRERCGGPW